MKLRSLLVAVVLACLGCGAGALPKPPQVDPSEQWIQAGKKIDFAVAQTKTMIQIGRAHV